MQNNQEELNPSNLNETEQLSNENFVDENSDIVQQNDISNIDNNPLNSSIDEEINHEILQTKTKHINKILISIIALLFSILIIGLILFFLGVFDTKEESIDVSTQEEIVQEENLSQTITKVKKHYQYNEEDINKDRINNKLQNLLSHQDNEQQIDQKESNNELFFDDELEKLITDDKPKDITNKEDTDDLDSSSLDEITSSIDVIKDEQTPIQETQKLDILSSSVESSNQQSYIQKENHQEFLKFIQVATLKYKLYTDFLKEIKAVDARISICQNEDGRIQIFIGPFLDDSKRDFVIKQINKSVVNDAFAIEFTQEEYLRRCGINDPF